MKEGWKYSTLGECCEILDRKRKPITKAKREPGEIPYYGATGLLDHVKDYIFDDRLVLLGEDGAKWGPNEDSAYIVEGKTWVNNHAHVLKPYEYLDYRLLVYYLKMADLSAYITGVTVPKLNQEKMCTIPIPLPPLPEQQRIVSHLDSSFAKIDALKTNAGKMLDEAKALFASALREAMKPKEGWEEKKLGEIALDFYRGSGIKRDQVTQEGTPCVRYGEIYTTYNYSFDSCVSHTNEDNISPKKYFSHGDILFAITGESVEDIGKCIAYLGNETCLCGGDIALMKHNQNAKFLAYALSTPDAKRQKGEGKTKLKVVHTSIPSLKEISIPIPPLPEQIRIVAHLDNLSAKVRQLEANFKKVSEECDALKQAILRETFE